MDPLNANEIPENGEATNPYATPIDIGVDTEARQILTMYRPSSAPWTGGWKLAILIVMGMTGLVMAGAFGLGAIAPATGSFGIPIFALAATAMIVRVLHAKVMVDWVTYGLATIGFGAAAFVCFIPVCIVVTIPTMAMVETFRTPGIAGFTIGGAIFTSITICGMFFVGLLRLYFNSKYRSQVFRESMMSESFTATSLEEGLDPWSIQATLKNRANGPPPFISDPYQTKNGILPDGLSTDVKHGKPDPSDENHPSDESQH